MPKTVILMLTPDGGSVEHLRGVIQAFRDQGHEVLTMDGVDVRHIPADKLDFRTLEDRIIATMGNPPCGLFAKDPSWFRDPNDPSLLQEEREKKANPWYRREQRGGRKSKNRRW